MTMSLLTSRIHVHERGLTRALMHERRSPLAATSSASQAAASAAAEPRVVIKLHKSTKALIAIITIIGVLVLILAAWKIRQRFMKRRNRALHGSSDEKRRGQSDIWGFSDVDIGVQQPQRVIFPHDAPATDASVGWVPQVQPWMTAGHAPNMEGAVAPPLPAKMKELQDEKVSVSGSPPPSYLAGGAEPLQPKRSPEPQRAPDAQPQPQQPPASAGRLLPPPPPPPAGLPPSPPHPSTPPTPPTSLKLKFVPRFGTTNTPQPSPPRTTSFASQQSSHPSSTSRPASSASDTSGSGSPKRKRLPRDMLVVQTFVPSLEDELPVVLGETLRLVDEFVDGWCLCQRIGGADEGVVKGVLPRFCLDERPMTRTKSKKKSLLRRF